MGRMRIGVAVIAAAQCECEPTQAKKTKEKQKLDVRGIKVHVLELCWECIETRVFNMAKPSAGIQHDKPQVEGTLNPAPATVFL